MASATHTIDQERKGQIHNGAVVSGPGGHKLGRVFSQSSAFGSTAGEYLVVERKFLFRTTGVFYIPMSAVAGVTDDAVTLNASHAGPGEQGWERPPVAA